MPLFWKDFRHPGGVLGALGALLARLGGLLGRLGGILRHLGAVLAHRTPSRRLWGGSWGRFWLILTHLGDVLGAQGGPKILPRWPKMPLRCLQDSPRFDFQQKSKEKCVLRARMAFSIRFLSDFISKIHPRFLKNH